MVNTRATLSTDIGTRFRQLYDRLVRRIIVKIRIYAQIPIAHPSF